MRIEPFTRAAFAGLAALALACSDAGDSPTAPGASPEETVTPALSLFGLPSLIPGLACRAAPHRQFDFWVGRWQVAPGPGAPANSASFITSEVDGCAIMEDWHAANGGRGRSLNAYDASDRQWHQHWVENSGFFPLRLDGKFANGAMVMQETYPDPYGTPTIYTDRYTWTRLGPDDVRQFVERSTDGGATFTPGFDGRYHRTVNPVVPQPAVYPYCTSTDPSLSLFQEFDFTVGSWSVTLDGPGPIGAAISRRHPASSDITKDLDGCLYEEKLTGPLGYEARVFTNIRPIDEVWRRTYVDNHGLRVYLTGPRIQDGKIVLTGSMPKLGGGTQQVRATFEQNANGFVERWERASGSGWEPLVTAMYDRR